MWGCFCSQLSNDTHKAGLSVELALYENEKWERIRNESQGKIIQIYFLKFQIILFKCIGLLQLYKHPEIKKKK